MKILFFCRRFYPLIGGVEKHVMEISKKLVILGNQVTVVTELDNRSSKFKFQNSKLNGIDIYRIPITKSEKLKKFQIWLWLWKNRHLVKQADIVHCHDVFFWYLPFRFLFPKKKVFTTFHGYEGSEPPNWKKIFMHKLSARLSKGTIAVGDWHEKWYGVKPEKVSYGAVEGEIKKLSRGGEPNTLPRCINYDFCFVGRLAKDTGIMTYLKALKILKDKEGNYSLVVCGDGPERKMAQDYCKINNLKSEFLGFVKEPQDLMKKSKFVFVSRYLGILEAMILKKLVFAVYDNKIKKDYLCLSPFAKSIIIEKEPLALAEKISYFASRPGKSKKIIEECFCWAKKQTWDKLTKMYLSLWRSSGFL